MPDPNNDALPKDMTDLPPARQRHIRLHPKAASIAERQILQDFLISLTSPNLNFFLFSFLSASALGLALFLNQPAFLYVGIVLSPFLSPIFGLALVPSHLKLNPGIKAFISLAVHLGLIFIAGVIAGWQQKTGQIDQLGLDRFGGLYWLDLIILAVSSFLAALTIIRKGELARLIGILLSYEILCPLAVAGFSLPLGLTKFWPGALLVSLTHLCVAIALAFITVLVLNLLPKKIWGWLLFLIPLILTAVMLATSANIGNRSSSIDTPSASATLQEMQASATRDNNVSLSPTVNDTATQVSTPTSRATATQNPRPKPSTTQTPTASPTPFLGLIESALGVVIRGEPNFNAEVIDYANDGDAIEIISETLSPDGARWYQVNARGDQTGWILANLVTIPTNTATVTP